jgi:hypothetical protein
MEDSEMHPPKFKTKPGPKFVQAMIRKSPQDSKQEVPKEQRDRPGLKGGK